MECLKPDSFFDLARFRSSGPCLPAVIMHGKLLEIFPATWTNTSNPNVRGLSCFMRPLPKTIVMWRGELLESGFEIMGGDVTKGRFRVRIGGEETNEAAVLHEGIVLWDEAIFIGPGAVLEPGAWSRAPR